MVLILLSALMCRGAPHDQVPRHGSRARDSLAFYIGGAIIAGSGSSGRRPGRWRIGRPKAGSSTAIQAAALNRAFVYGVFGVLLILVGAVVDWQT